VSSSNDASRSSSATSVIASSTPGKRGDFGADLVITRRKKRMVVQAKRWSKNVGVQAVQEVNTARSMYRAEGALVVTSGGFTRAARKLAASAGVELWDEPELVRALLRVRGKRQTGAAFDSRVPTRRRHRSRARLC
jgi:restriction system protein